jgi:hypothetical protein
MAIGQINRTRLLAALCIVPVVAAGLYARSQRANADPATLSGFLATYAGDTLWPIMFFLIGRFVFPQADRWRLVAGTLALTLTLEIGQLWQPPTLQWLRDQPVIGFVLGNSFLWSDVACLLIGSVLAFLLDLALCGGLSQESSNY